MRKRNRQKPAKSQSQTPQKPPPSPPPPTVKGNENPEDGNRKDNRSGKRDTSEKPTHWTSYAQGVCAIALVVITGFYTYYASQQLDLTRDQFTKDQRLYIWIALPIFHEIQPGQVGQFVSGNIKFENFGKSPALHINLENRQVFFGPDAGAQMEKMFRFLDTNKVVYSNIGTPALVPVHMDNLETILNVDVRSFYSIPSQPSLDWLAVHPEGVIMAGRVIYEDMAGNSYWTDYCVVRSEPGHEPRPCRNHNDIR